MAKSTDVRVVQANVSFEPVPFRAPLKFGGRVMESSTLINVEVTVETKGRKHATGFGSMPVGNIWAWPSDKVTPDQSEKAMRLFAERTIGLANAFDDFGHPVELMYQLSAEYQHQGKQV